MLKSKMTDFLELKINSYFDKLISSLNGRRNALLTELKERRQLELSRKEEHLETVQAITEVRGNLTARAPLNRLHTFEDRHSNSPFTLLGVLSVLKLSPTTKPTDTST